VKSDWYDLPSTTPTKVKLKGQPGKGDKLPRVGVISAGLEIPDLRLVGASIHEILLQRGETSGKTVLPQINSPPCRVP